MKLFRNSIFWGLSFVFWGGGALLQAARTEAGLTLLETAGARSAALGDAFSLMPDDISASVYNPASLASLKSGHALFHFQRGLADDAFGQLLIGVPKDIDGWGLSIRYYDGGEASLFDGTTQRTVQAQQDVVVGLGWGQSYGPVGYGLKLKYFSSELAETTKATAFLGDAGFTVKASPRFHVGASVQNLGQDVQFVSVADDAPRSARLGFSWNLIPGQYNTTLLLDVPYFFNQKEIRQRLGIESHVGPVAFRLGYKNGSDLQEFSIGTGLLVGKATFDYAFGLVDEFDSRHQVSLSMRFRGTTDKIGFTERRIKEVQIVEKVKPKPIRIKPKKMERTVVEFTETSDKPFPNPNLLYVVKRGDTWWSIAERFYGTGKMWNHLFLANRHMIQKPKNLKVGQKILIPRGIW